MRISAGIPAICIAIFWALAVGVNAPGHLSYDTVVQLTEARTAALNSMHPPSMSLLMAVFDGILPGTSLFLIFMTFPFFAAMLITAYCGPDKKVSVYYLPVLVLFLISPLVLVYQGIIWKDVLFANLSVLAFALGVVSVRSRSKIELWMLIAAASVVSGTAALMRQQGIIVPVLLAVALSINSGARIRLNLLRGLTSLGIAGLTILGADLAAKSWSIDDSSNAIVLGTGVLQRFDIVGMAAAGVPLPNTLSLLQRRAIQEYASLGYTPARVDNTKHRELPPELSDPNFPVGVIWREMLWSDSPMLDIGSHISLGYSGPQMFSSVYQSM